MALAGLVAVRRQLTLIGVGLAVRLDRLEERLFALGSAGEAALSV